MSRRSVEVACIATVVQVVDDTYAIVRVKGESVLKARILASTGAIPTQGQSVIMEYIPASSEWYIVAINTEV